MKWKATIPNVFFGTEISQQFFLTYLRATSTNSHTTSHKINTYVLYEHFPSRVILTVYGFSKHFYAFLLLTKTVTISSRGFYVFVENSSPATIHRIARKERCVNLVFQGENGASCSETLLATLRSTRGPCAKNHDQERSVTTTNPYEHSSKTPRRQCPALSHPYRPRGTMVHGSSPFFKRDLWPSTKNIIKSFLLQYLKTWTFKLQTADIQSKNMRVEGKAHSA
uniref:Uncharacterized protein n=1 Tax=Glossina pallidipes TaxID=7398 RepID=A0A1B0AC54_GLOPL